MSALPRSVVSSTPLLGRRGAYDLSEDRGIKPKLFLVRGRVVFVKFGSGGGGSHRRVEGDEVPLNVNGFWIDRQCAFGDFDPKSEPSLTSKEPLSLLDKLQVQGVEPISPRFRPSLVFKFGQESRPDSGE
jgi:hypothetical protein